MSAKRQASTQEEQSEEEQLLEALIEEVDSMIDSTDKQARNAAGEYPMLKATGRANAYQEVRDRLETRKQELKQARVRASTPGFDKGTSISAARMESSILSEGDPRFWWPEREAVIMVGGYGKKRVKQGRHRGAELYTHVVFAVIDLARRDGDTVTIDNRVRLMGNEIIPATDALELIRDECLLLERASATEEAADPRTTGRQRKLYHVADDAT